MEDFHEARLASMQLYDRADGIHGHYGIARQAAPDSKYWEFYNKGIWCSHGQVFTNKKHAKRMMLKIYKKEHKFMTLKDLVNR